MQQKWGNFLRYRKNYTVMSLFYYKNTLYKNFQDVQDISRMFFKNISYFHIFIYFFILNFWSDTFGINTKNESRMTLSEKLKNRIPILK